jgi:hypothetical protein
MTDTLEPLPELAMDARVTPEVLLSHLASMSANPFIPELHTDDCDDTSCVRCRTDQLLLADDLELAITGGCPTCGLEANQMCVACGSCNCDRHDTCTRPA